MADEDTAATGKRAKEEPAGGGEESGAGEPEAKRAKADDGAVEVPAETLAAVSRVEASTSVPKAGADALADRPATKAKLEWLFSTGKMPREEMTPGTLQELSEFSDSKGVEIVEHYAEADLSDVRNKCAFFGGVIKRFRDQQAAAIPAGCARMLRACAYRATGPRCPAAWLTRHPLPCVRVCVCVQGRAAQCVRGGCRGGPAARAPGCARRRHVAEGAGEVGEPVQLGQVGAGRT